MKKRSPLVFLPFALLLVVLGCQSQYMTAGKIYIEQNNYDAAIEQFKLAVQAEPTNPEAYVWLGKAYAHKKQYEEACKQTEKAVEIDPKTIDALKKDQFFNYWAVYYNAGMKHVENKEFDLAVTRIQRSLDFDSKSALSYNLLAFCYMKLKKDDEALKTYERAIELIPDNIESYINLAAFHRKDKKIEEEYAILVKAKKIVGKPEWLKAQDEETMKRRKQAAASVYIDLGNNLLKQEKPAEAEIALRKAIELDPDNKDVNFNYGLALMAMEKYSDALASFKKVVELDSLDAEGHNYMGFAYLKLERYTDAVDAFTRVITIDPCYCEAYINRAFAYRELGDKNKAYDDAKLGTECKENPDVFESKYCKSNASVIEYKITGSAETVDITYTNESGGTAQKSDISIPWSYSFKAIAGSSVYLSAQNKGKTGSVTVTIYRNGSVFKTTTSDGEYVIATASGTL